MSDPIIDTLEAQSRKLDREIRGHDPAGVTEDMARAVIQAFDALAKAQRLSVTSVARLIGYEQSTLAQVLRMRYKGNWRQVIVDLDRWMEDQRKAPLKPDAFVETRVASRIYTVAELAMHTRKIAAVYGPAGIGKTMALQALAADKPGSVLVSLQSIGATPAGVIDAIARAMGIIHPSRGGGRTMSSRLASFAVEDVLKGQQGRGLLIIDEVHKLMHRRNHAALTVLRDLFDATKCPQLWSSTIDVVGFLRAECGPREPLSQIRTRIIKCVDLAEGIQSGGGGDGGQPLFTIDEVRRFIANRKMRFVPSAEQAVMRLINAFDGGYLRTLDTLLDTIHMLAGESVVTNDIVRRAAAFLQLDMDAGDTTPRREQASATA